MTKQNIISLQLSELLPKVKELQQNRYRLCQICCTRTPQAFELSYSFDKNFDFQVLRIILPDNTPALPSITDIYSAAFVYENEIHDLFGFKISGLNLDYQGNFYKLKEKFPYAAAPSVAAKPVKKE
jgi:ech hydrogenase subunit D